MLPALCLGFSRQQLYGHGIIIYHDNDIVFYHLMVNKDYHKTGTFCTVAAEVFLFINQAKKMPKISGEFEPVNPSLNTALKGTTDPEGGAIW